MKNQRLTWAAAVVLSGWVWIVAVVAAQPPPRAVIVDTDAGHDDLMAIAYLLARADVRIEAITIAYGLAHQGPGARNVLRLLDLAGRTGVPVYLGRETPRGAHNPFPADWRTRSDEMAGVSLPPSLRSPERRSAVDFLVERLGDPSRPVDVLAIGALTNVADVLERQPSLAAVRSLVIMGGAVDVPGNVSDGAKGANTTSEWNVYADPDAARRVLAAGLPLLLIPLDATNIVRVDAAFLRDLHQRAATPLGRLVSELLASASHRIDAGLYYAWDPLAAVALSDRSAVRSERVSVSVRLVRPEDGRTARDQQGTSIEVALGADKKRFVDLFVTTLARR